MRKLTGPPERSGLGHLDGLGLALVPHRIGSSERGELVAQGLGSGREVSEGGEEFPAFGLMTHRVDLSGYGRKTS